MIEIRYKRILALQFFFLLFLGIFLYSYFKRSFDLHTNGSFIFMYSTIWFLFIFFNLLFIRIYALPTKKLLKQLASNEFSDEMSWSMIEESISKKDVHLQNLQSEFEIENLKYKMLLDSLHDPVCIFNKDLTILYSNHAFSQLFSLPENDHSSLLEVTRNLYFQDFIRQVIATNESNKLNEFSFDQIQDSYKNYFEIKVFPLKDIATYLCILHDVTERKMADQIREDFVSNFSHEVRTPLTILNGQMQTLKLELEKNKEMQPAYKQIFEKVENNSRRLINLFNDLLRLTSVEKKKDLIKEEIDIEPLIDGLAEELVHNYPHKTIKFHFDFKTKNFLIDYNLFEQVMINLIDNALKYAGALGNITIKTYSEDDMNILEISDDGVGIPEDQQHRIFERFFRVDASRSSEIEGTGLGLSIVKHIVQKHEGRIKVASKKDHGTTFTISLPRYQ